MLDFQVAEDGAVGNIDEREWDSHAASFYSSKRWITFSSTHGDANLVVVVAKEGSKIVGLLPMHHFHSAPPKYYDIHSLMGSEGGLHGGAEGPVILGTRQGYEAEILTNTHGEKRKRVISGLIREARIESMSRTGAEPWMLYASTDTTNEVLSAVSDARSAFLDARVRITGIGGGRDSYLDLLSPNAAARMRKERAKFERSGFRLAQENLSECHDELGRLSSAVLQRYGHPISEDEERDRFARQVSLLSDRCVIFTARDRAGDLVGFTQFFRWGDQLIGRVHGVDDAVAKNAALYYNLTYYAPVDAAPELGIESIDLGCDSFEAKVRRGGKIEKLHALTFNPTADLSRDLNRLAETTGEAMRNWSGYYADEETI